MRKATVYVPFLIGVCEKLRKQDVTRPTGARNTGCKYDMTVKFALIAIGKKKVGFLVVVTSVQAKVQVGLFNDRCISWHA